MGLVYYFVRLVDVAEVSDNVGGDGGFGDNVDAIAVVHFANKDGSVIVHAKDDADVAIPT